jgi:Ca-activated chloride channel family protein
MDLVGGIIMKNSIVFVTTLLISTQLAAWNLFTDYSKLTPTERITKLQEEQVNNPHDPIINYNLGVAFYKNEKFQDAKTNFDRALTNSKKNPLFTQQCLFNLANSGYKLALKLLPNGWEQEGSQIDQQILEKSISEANGALEGYKKILTQEPQHQKAHTNKTLVEELLKKLEKKRQQQQQQKNDKDNKKDDDKENKDQKDQSQNNQQSDQNNQQQKQDNSTGKSQVKDDHKESNQNQSESSRENSANKSDNTTGQGKNNKLDQSKNENKEQEQLNNHKPNDQQEPKRIPQPSDSESTQAEQETQENKKTESVEMRGLRAMLENLQNDESKTQKQIMQRKMAQQPSQTQQRNQKPW